ncbi:DNA-binding transcriptional response regulator [Methanophagales archaeon]|nr:DNA-binding transcriptional response regulator [Methanophagales archaeon]
MDNVLKGQKTGIDASYEIKAKLDIPIIFLTAYTDITLINKAKSTEPYAYLVKPFNWRQLLAAIEMALYKSQIEMRQPGKSSVTILLAENVMMYTIIEKSHANHIRALRLRLFLMGRSMNMRPK